MKSGQIDYEIRLHITLAAEDRKERLCRPCDPWSLAGPSAATELNRYALDKLFACMHHRLYAIVYKIIYYEVPYAKIKNRSRYPPNV